VGGNRACRGPSPPGVLPAAVGLAWLCNTLKGPFACSCSKRNSLVAAAPCNLSHACCVVLCCAVPQAVFGLERLVDLTIAKQVPAVAYGTTIAIRFVNNVIGECSAAAQGCRARACPQRGRDNPSSGWGWGGGRLSHQDNNCFSCLSHTQLYERL
jgi:hypothetical protein